MKSPLLFSLVLPLAALCFTNPKPAGTTGSPQHITVANDSKEGVTEFTDANFDSKVLKSAQLSVVDFWAAWCGPCRQVGPVIEELAKEYAGKVNIGKLDVDHNENITVKYNIRSIPTILFIKNGKVVDRIIGVEPKSKIEKKIKQLM